MVLTAASSAVWTRKSDTDMPLMEAARSKRFFCSGSRRSSCTGRCRT
jgi:hypothetical protein